MSRRRSWVAFLGAFWPTILGATLVAGGLAAIVLGYFGVSGTVHVGLQLPYLVSGALLGLALVVLGAALLVVQVLVRQTRLTRRLLDAVRASGEARTAEAPQGDGAVLVTPGARSFHRPGCLLVEAKAAEALEPHDAVERGLVPCPLCDPTVPARN